MVSLNNQLAEATLKFFRLLREKAAYKSKFVTLSIVQLHILIFIAKQKSVKMNDISNEFDIEMSTATGVINTLFKLKLVKRKEDPKDRRVVNISLTSHGEKLLGEAKNHHNRRIGKLMSYLSENDKQKLLQILKTLEQKTRIINL